MKENRFRYYLFPKKNKASYTLVIYDLIKDTEGHCLWFPEPKKMVEEYEDINHLLGRIDALDSAVNFMEDLRPTFQKDPKEKAIIDNENSARKIHVSRMSVDDLQRFDMLKNHPMFSPKKMR